MRRSDFLKILGFTPFAGTAILSGIAKIDEPVPEAISKHADINVRHCLLRDSKGNEVALFSDFELNVNHTVDEFGRLLFSEWDIEFEDQRVVQYPYEFIDKMMSKERLVASISDTDGIFTGDCYMNDCSVETMNAEFFGLSGRLVGNGILVHETN